MIILVPFFGAHNFFSLTPSNPLFAAVMLLCSDNETFPILDLYLHLLSGPFFFLEVPSPTFGNFPSCVVSFSGFFLLN